MIVTGKQHQEVVDKLTKGKQMYYEMHLQSSAQRYEADVKVLQQAKEIRTLNKVIQKRNAKIEGLRLEVEAFRKSERKEVLKAHHGHKVVEMNGFEAAHRYMGD